MFATLFISLWLCRLWEAGAGVDPQVVGYPPAFGVEEVNLERNDLTRTPHQIGNTFRGVRATERRSTARVEERATRIAVADARVQTVEYEVDQPVQRAAGGVAHQNEMLHSLPRLVARPNDGLLHLARHFRNAWTNRRYRYVHCPRVVALVLIVLRCADLTEDANFTGGRRTHDDRYRDRRAGGDRAGITHSATRLGD